MKILIKKIFGRLVQFYKIKIHRESLAILHAQWIKDNGDSILRLSYPLNENSVVFDVGGYRGIWAEKIINLYNPHIYIFEPVPEYYSEIVKQLGINPRVFLYNFGLSDKDMNTKIALLSNASSVYKKSKQYINIKLRDINKFLAETKIKKIDLIKINIEGGEYPLLNRLISSRTIEICQNIQVQFHNFIPQAKSRRNKIREHLKRTHYLTYDYPFIWENWRIKNLQ